MIRWLANWRERRRIRQEELRFLDDWIIRRERRAEEERQRKDYLAGYDEAARLWASLFGQNIRLAQAIKKSNEHRGILVIGWAIGENDD